MPQKRIFVFEYVSGGGFNKEEISASLLCEGYAMLRALLEDFKKLNYQTITQLDERIFYLSKFLNPDELHAVSHNDDFLNVYKQCLEKANYCFIIAPEFSNILYKLTKIALNYQKNIYSIGLEGINLGASKLKTYKFFKDYNLSTPKTYPIQIKDGKINFDFIYEKLEEYHVPFIIKPEDGVGAESIYYFQSKKELELFFSKKVIPLNTNRNYILQEFIQGTDLSVSIINNPLEDKLTNKLSILSINSQNIGFKGSFGASYYLGGYTPINQYAFVKKKLESLLEKVDLHHFKGIFGIDFVKTLDNEIYFIEINPRLTTSYIGIRNIMNQNPLIMLEQAYEKKITFKIKHTGFSEFLRLDLNYDGIDSLRGIIDTIIPKLMQEIPELFTPPICLSSANSTQKLEFSCFVVTKCKDHKDSKKRLTEILNELKKAHFNLIK
jgi:predicted ATP-grasp superfamily ATP-dependent carboligase